MQLWLHSICELQLLMVKLSSPEEMKGYLLNAYHCWALLVGHLSCYKQFFLPDGRYKCKLFCNYCGRLNTFYFESKKERKISGSSKGLWILQPDQNMPSTIVSEGVYQTGSTSSIYLLLVIDTVLWKTSFRKRKKKTSRKQIRNLSTIRKPVAELRTKLLF